MDLNKCTSVRCGYPLNKTKYESRKQQLCLLTQLYSNKSDDNEPDSIDHHNFYYCPAVVW